MQRLHAGLDPNLLIALDALLAERSVTRAARRLGLTQSGMSHKLRVLRDALGDPLLVGSRGSLVLTARACAISVPLAAALAALAGAVKASEPFDPATARRHFTIATSDHGELLVVARLFELFRAEAPHITLAIERPGPALGDRLAAGTIDLAVGPRFPLGAPFRQKTLTREGFVVFARDGHPRMRRAPSLATYLALSHVLIAPRGAPGGVVDDLLARRGLARHIALRTPHFVTVPFLIARSDLVVTAPIGLADEAARHLLLRRFAPPFALPEVELFLVWHERAHVDPGHRWLRAIAERVVPHTAGRGRQARAAPDDSNTTDVTP